MKNIFTIVIFSLFTALTAYAQCDYLTAFNTDYEGGLSLTIKSGGKLFFSAPDSLYGRELWVTDGTAEGTHMVKDINPGTSGSVSVNFGFSAYNFKGILYFKANNGITGPELWRSDGTEAGTWLVKDLYGGNSDYGIGDFASTDSVLFFVAKGTTLWRSNGTTSGTYPIGSFMIIRSLSTFKNNIYFSAAIDNNGEELWKCNGATGHIILLKDLNGTPGTSLPCNFHATKNALYFMAVTNAGWELWKTTGTSESTKMVKDINPGGANGVLDHYSDAVMANIGNTIYFRATDGVTGFQLWKSDGTDTGTVRLSNIAGNVSQYCTFPIVNGKVFFNSYGGPNYWQYDPSSNTVSATGYPFYSYFDFNDNRNASFIGSHLYYASEDSAYGAEMWQSDGITSATHRIQETHLVNNFSTIYTIGFNSILGTLGSKLLFTLARRPYDTKIPVFTYDTSLNAASDFSPSVLVPVPLPNNKMHLVWNRIENASLYQIRYRTSSGNSIWENKETQASFEQFALDAGTDYTFQVRALCNNIWAPWSDKLTYNTSFTPHDYIINILANRAEDAATTRIYWLKTPEITKMQLRYRPAGTTAWTIIQNSRGLIRLTNLSPSVFYEYQYRSFTDGHWGGWYPGSLYFITPEETVNSIAVQPGIEKTKLQLSISPNPAKSIVHINDELPLNAYFTVTDAAGNILKTGTLNNSTIDLSGLKPGILTITIQKEGFRQSGKILKQ